MTTRNAYLFILSLAALALTAAGAERDPFWPIGYSPPPPVQEQPAVPDVIREAAPPPKPAPPTEKPITDADWAKARKALSISGFTKSVKPETREVRILALINRQTYSAGDTLTFVHTDMRFQWKVESVTESDVLLTPSKAERIAVKPNDLKPNP